jgi:hypothetical protein
MILTFYDSTGQPFLYTKDRYHLFLFDGTPIAYARGASIWSYDGRHLGRFSSGWIRDNQGKAAFFTENAEGGPVTPAKRIRATPARRILIPLKQTRELAPASQPRRREWSPLSGLQFFKLADGVG